MGDRIREELQLPELAPPVSHYTHAVRFGDLLFISGLVGLDVDLKVVSHDVVKQTEKILQDMSLILGRYGAGFSAVLRVTVYLTDIEDRSKINPVRQACFGNSRPASTLIGVKALVVPGLKVEIDAIAGISPEGPSRTAQPQSPVA
jgi:2-iminobutanoate/2-iminopropanoate deaminase